MFLIDSHCHINMLDCNKLHKNIDDILHKAKKNNVHHVLAVSTSLNDSKKIFNTIKNKNVSYSCGVHPLNQEKYTFSQLIALANSPKIIALGETGLDYVKNQNKLIQIKSFRNHIRAGNFLKKPIIIHNRNAYKDIINIIKEENIETCGGVVHCFTENSSIAKKFLDIGLYISFSGIITFNNVHEIVNAVKFVPLDRLLIETDSPYLTPVPFRGKENQPAFLKYIAERVSIIKNVSLNLLSHVTKQNFCNLFNVDL